MKRMNQVKDRVRIAVEDYAWHRILDQTDGLPRGQVQAEIWDRGQAQVWRRVWRQVRGRTQERIGSNG